MNKKRLALLGVLLLFIVCVISYINLDKSFERRNEMITISNIPIKTLPKHLKYNKNTYWISSDIEQYKQLPDGYIAGGKIGHKHDNTNDTVIFESSFGNYGDIVYTCSSNAESVYMYDSDTQKYQIFVSKYLKNDLLMLNNVLYENHSGIENYFNEKPFSEDEFEFVGKINSNIYHEIPSANFQSNIPDSINGEIFINKLQNEIYIKMPDEQYIKLIQSE